MFSRSTLPGLVCIALGAFALTVAAVGCGVCSIPEDANTPGCGHLVAEYEAKQAAEVIEPPEATVEVVNELQRRVKSLESYSQKLAEIVDQQALLLSRQNDEHAKQLENLSLRIDQRAAYHDALQKQANRQFNDLKVIAERLTDLERLAADVPPRLPLPAAPPKTSAADPKPARLVEPVAVIPKAQAPKEFDGVTITAHTTDGCPPCQAFKLKDSKALELLGASVAVLDPINGEPGPFPWYEVNHRGRLLPIHRGTLDAVTLRSLLKSHR